MTAKLIASAPCCRTLEVWITAAALALRTPWGRLSTPWPWSLLHPQRLRRVELRAWARFGEVGCRVNEGTVIRHGGVPRAFDGAIAKAITQLSLVRAGNAAYLCCLSFKTQSSGDRLVPLDHLAVRLRGECFAGQPAWEGGTVGRIGDVKALYCGLEEGYVFFWLE